MWRLAEDLVSRDVDEPIDACANRSIQHDACAVNVRLKEVVRRVQRPRNVALSRHMNHCIDIRHGCRDRHGITDITLDEGVLYTLQEGTISGIGQLVEDHNIPARVAQGSYEL